MTVSNAITTKKSKSCVMLELTGSQISLSPRPVANLTWSSNYRAYPMRRSVSVTGFQAKDVGLQPNVCGRPLSADNIRYANKKKFVADFAYSQGNISPSNQEFKNCHLSENEFENIINGYSENKQVSHKQNHADGCLKPGLSAKPPLPFSVEQKSKPSCGKENYECGAVTLAEQEAFDEIIALKFQRWFPDAVVSHADGFSSEEEANDLELLSYSEQKFHTCEYRYEVTKTKKNKKLLTFDKSKSQPPALKNTRFKGKKVNARVKSKTTRHGPSNQAERAKDSGEVDEGDKDRKSVESNCSSGSEENVFTKAATFHSESVGNDSHSLQWLEEQDLKMLLVKQNQKPENSDQKCSNSSQHKPKIMANNAHRGATSSPNCINSNKKSKKISFLIDKPSIEEKPNSMMKNPRAPYDSKPISDERFPDTESSNSEVNDIFRGTDGSPQHSAGSQMDEVISWMAANRSGTPHSKLTTPESERGSSMYEEIVDILKDIEKENIRNQSDQGDVSSRNLPPSTSAKAIWSLLEEAEKNSNIANSEMQCARTEDDLSANLPLNSSKSSNTEEPKSRNRLSDLLRYPSTELAQKVMTLQLLLDERESAVHDLNSRLSSQQQMNLKQKQEFEYSTSKQLRLIDQLKAERKSSAQKHENTIKEMERKQSLALQNQEEKFKIELKRSLEKQAAADKMERERWMETKSQKIKELAVKGLEPELNRMAAAHEETTADIHKFYKRQLTDLEETLNRRMAVQKEKLEAEKEKALAIEREISRQKLEDEISELEKRYQDQRKRLLAEVHVERENMERANEATFAIREKENERKWQMKSVEVQKKIESLQSQHQDEILKLQQSLEAEKQLWIKNQAMELLEKENKIKEHYKKERDKHIELVIQKLENESGQKEQASEQKMKKLKEQYEAEINDVEATNENLRRKLNESRSEVQKCEDLISQIRAQLNQSNTDYIILKEKHERLVAEQGEIHNIAKSEISTKINLLQSELNQTHLIYESKLKSMKGENERELSQMYNRVKEMIVKKDEVINSLKKQKDAALTQCNQLEKLLDMKRRNPSSY